jgi:hypothetical protein
MQHFSIYTLRGLERDMSLCWVYPITLCVHGPRAGGLSLPMCEQTVGSSGVLS